MKKSKKEVLVTARFSNLRVDTYPIGVYNNWENNE